MLGGVAVILALLLYGILRYPASVTQGGMLSLVISAGALLAYGVAAWWSRRVSSDDLPLALARGVKPGLLLGAAAIVNLSLEVFADLGRLRAVLGVTMWGLMFLVFGIAGSATYRQLRSLPLSVVSSVWSAMVATVITLLYGFSIGLLFMPHMQQILAGAYAQSGMTDPQAFVIRNTLNSAASHLLIAPLMAIFFGLVGGVASAVLRDIRHGTAVALSISEFLLLAGGVTALWIASSLDRPDRPPFVMAGLAALGVALACAHPVILAAHRTATTE